GLLLPYKDHLVFSPDSKLLALVHDGGLQWLDTTTGDLSEVIPAPYGQYGTQGAFSPDGKTFAFTPTDGTILFFSIGGKQTSTLKISPKPERYDMAYSLDGNLLVSEGDLGRLRLYNVVTGAVLATAHNTYLGSHLSLSPDGKLLMSTSGDVIHLWGVVATG